MHRRQFLRTAAAATPLVAGCSGGGGGNTPTETSTPTPTPTPPSESADAEVTINFFQFEPQKVRIDTGETVRWTNEQGTAHRVVSATYVEEATEWEFDSGELAQGESLARTFESEGVYHYFCDTHGKEQNCGVVLVGGTEFPAERMPCNEGSVQ